MEPDTGSPELQHRVPIKDRSDLPVDRQVRRSCGDELEFENGGLAPEAVALDEPDEERQRMKRNGVFHWPLQLLFLGRDALALDTNEVAFAVVVLRALGSRLGTGDGGEGEQQGMEEI